MPRIACLAPLLLAASSVAAAAVPAVPSAADAPIAYLYDVSSGQVLFEREADRRFMPASIVKAMTTYLAFEWLKEGRIDARQRYVMDRETFADWGGRGSTMYLPANSLTPVDRLLAGIAAVSANDASAVLAKGAAGSIANWTRAMNAKAAELGMADSRFNTPNGWMDDGQTFTTARDLGKLGTALATRHPQLYARYVGRPELTHNGIRQYNHDPITGRVEGADGIKTGFTNQAGHGFLGSAERDGRRLVMVVATSPRQSLRNGAARSLIEWGFAAFESRQLFDAGKTIANAEVQGGAALRVGLVANEPVRLSTRRGTHADIRLEVRYNGPLIAPIEQGEQIAQLVTYLDGERVGQVPLNAAETVGTAGAFAAIRNAFASWLS